VCTPQDAALKIALRSLQMFRGLNVPPLGIIENMSWFVCGTCGEEHHIFDHGQAERAAQRLGVPYLGPVPLERSIREEADAGAPVYVPPRGPARAAPERFANPAPAWRWQRLGALLRPPNPGRGFRRTGSSATRITRGRRIEMCGPLHSGELIFSATSLNISYGCAPMTRKRRAKMWAGMPSMPTDVARPRFSSMDSA